MRLTLGSLSYRFTRRLGLLMAKLTQRQRNLEPLIEWGDAVLHGLDRSMGRLLFGFKTPRGLDRSVHGLHFPTPLTFAAFKDDLALLRIWARAGIGGGCFKTIMNAPRDGNPQPRIQSITIDNSEAVINAMGLPGKGTVVFLDHLAANDDLWRFGIPLGFSVGGESPEEYLDVLTQIEAEISTKHPGQYYYELNISCPNTHEGQNLMKDVSLLKSLLKKCRQATEAPISVKLSPDMSDGDLSEYAHAISEHDKTMVNVGNTTFRHCEDVGLKKGDITIGGGGMSGAPLFERTLTMIQIVKQANIPIIATGGITTPERAQKALKAGATLIGMATGLIQDPYIIPRINKGLARGK